MNSEHREGLIWVLLAVTGYAFMPVIGRTIYQVSDFQPTDIAFWRFAFATPIIWLVVIFREQSSDVIKAKAAQPIPTARLLPLGIIYAVCTLCAFIGLQYISASTYVVLFYTYPAMVALISLFMGVRLSGVAWLALGMTLIGILLTVPDFSLNGEEVLLGVSVALLNAFSLAIYFLLVSRVMKNVQALGRSTALIISGTLLTLCLTLPFYGLKLPATLELWGLLLTLGAVCTAMPIFMINIGIQKLGVTRASIVSSVEPVMSMVLAIGLLNETVLPVQWLGAAIITAAVVILEARPRRKPQVRAGEY